MLKIDELEKTLIKHWSCFLDIRKMLQYANSIAKNKLKLESPKLTTLTVSNCKITDQGLVIWIDYKLLEKDSIVNATTELILGLDGSIMHSKTI